MIDNQPVWCRNDIVAQGKENTTVLKNEQNRLVVTNGFVY